MNKSLLIYSILCLISLINGQNLRGRGLETTIGDSVFDSSSRFLMTGTRKVLVVRVTSVFNEEPETSIDQLSQAYFGIGSAFDNIAPVADQFASCSDNHFNMVPATGPGVVNGVLEIELKQQIDGTEAGNLRGPVHDAMNNKLGAAASEVDIFVSIFPNNNKGWIAFAGGNWVYMNNNWGISVRTVMHEMGHAIGWAHSGYNGNSYADKSGQLGYVGARGSGDYKCFNSHKNWISGWFDEKKNIVDTAQSSSVMLPSFVDVSKTSEPVLLKAGDLYIQYNRAKDFNRDTSLGANAVMLVQASGDRAVSDLKAMLYPGDTYTYTESDGRTFVVEVCSTKLVGGIDYATVGFRPLGSPTTGCQTSTDAPSSSPTSSPTKSPTNAPTTASPTQAPSSSPTPSPTTPITEVPTVGEDPYEEVEDLTRSPTRSPTMQPTSAPTSAPRSCFLGLFC